MAIVDPKVYFDNANYRDPVGAVLEGAAEETQRRENLKDQRQKRAVAQQLANLQDRQQYLDEVKAGFHQDTTGYGPQMAGNATTGALPGGVLGRVKTLRSNVGSELAMLGPRGESDAERELGERHQYAMEEDQANNAARSALQKQSDEAATGRLTAQEQAAYDRLQDQLRSNEYIARLRERGEMARASIAERTAERQQASQDRLFAAGAVSQAQTEAAQDERAIPRDLLGQPVLTSPEAVRARAAADEANRLRQRYVALAEQQVPGFKAPPADQQIQQAVSDFASQYQSTTDPAQQYAIVQDLYSKLHALNAGVPAMPPTPNPTAGTTVMASGDGAANATPAQQAAIEKENQLYQDALSQHPEQKAKLDALRQQRILAIMNGQQ